jgi:chromosomal replication initiator protein
MFQALSAQSRARVVADEPFLLLPEAQFAWAAATRGLEQPRQSEQRGQLTCIIGAKGCGKSLLCRRALNAALRKHPRWKIAIQSGQDLLRGLHQAEQSSELVEYFDAAGKLAVIVCEDLDRAFTVRDQGEIWSVWIDDLLSRGVQALVTVSDSPGRCEAFSPRIVSRLHGGLCAQIGNLERDSRQVLVRFAAAQFQLALPEDAVGWLADRPPGTPQALWTAVEQIAEQRAPCELAAVQRVFAADGQTNGKPQLAVIAREVANEFGVTVTEMRSHTRHQALRVPRQCAMFLARDLASCPMQEIGQFFGRRTHTSVSHSCRRLQELLPGSPTLREHVERLRQRLSHRLGEHCG